jgi:hypothetical protein
VDEPGEDVDGDEQLHRYHLLVNPDGSGGGGTSGEGGATGESGAGAGEAGEGGALGEGGASGGAP